jgi:hypothetical protein
MNDRRRALPAAGALDVYSSVAFIHALASEALFIHHRGKAPESTRVLSGWFSG